TDASVLPSRLSSTRLPASAGFDSSAVGFSWDAFFSGCCARLTVMTRQRQTRIPIADLDVRFMINQRSFISWYFLVAVKVAQCSITGTTPRAITSLPGGIDLTEEMATETQRHRDILRGETFSNDILPPYLCVSVANSVSVYCGLI